MYTDRTDFDVTTGRFQNQGYIQRVYCNNSDHYVSTQFVCRCSNTYGIFPGNNVDFATALNDVKIDPPLHMEIG